MKKPLAFLLAFIALYLSFSALYPKKFGTAAEANYRSISKGAVFYSSPDFSEDNALFILPENYFVTVISETPSYVYAEYAASSGKYVKLKGYVKTEYLAEKDGVPPLYPVVTLSSIKSTSVYKNADLSSPLVSVLTGQTVAVYGESLNNLALFVHFDGEFGYVYKSAFETYETPAHPVNGISAPSATPSSEVPAVSSPTELSESLQIILIIFICIPVVVITFLMFSKSKKD